MMTQARKSFVLMKYSLPLYGTSGELGEAKADNVPLTRLDAQACITWPVTQGIVQQIGALKLNQLLLFRVRLGPDSWLTFGRVCRIW